MNWKHPLLVALVLGSSAAKAADLTTSYAAPGDGGRVASVVTLCPSSDGSRTAVDCKTAPTQTSPASATHAPVTPITLAAGSGSVVLTLGQIVSGCDLTFTGGGPFTVAYTTKAAPGSVTATSTIGLMIPAGSYYHCPTAAPLQGLSVYNTSGSTAGVIGGDAY